MMNSMIKGFTLIEMLVVVAIVGLLAATAIPSYNSYIVRTNRADAQEKLTEVAFEMERFANRNRTYTLDMTQLGYAADPVISDEGFYSVDAAVCAGATITTCVNLTATPVAGGRQAGDGNFTLDTRGAKTGKW